MPPAARVTDIHTCPMVTPGVPPIPHVGGPILPPGVPTVLIDFLPAATVTDMAMCVGPPDVIAMGSAGVFINFLPAARLGDPTVHGGVIVMGSPTCIIGEVGAAFPGTGGLAGVVLGLAASSVDAKVSLSSIFSTAVNAIKGLIASVTNPSLGEWRAARCDAITQALSDQNALLKARKADLEAWKPETRNDVVKWFGSDDETTRQTLLDRVNKEIALNENMTMNDFYPADPPQEGRFAYVIPDQPGHNIYLDSAFDNAPPTGDDSKAGVLTHEMSHFNDIAGTDDHEYGQAESLKLAKSDPSSALGNADNFEYFVESAKPSTAPAVLP